MASSANCEYLLSCVWLQSFLVTTFPIVTPRTQRQSTTTLQFYQSDDDVVYITNIAPGCGEISPLCWVLMREATLSESLHLESTNWNRCEVWWWWRCLHCEYCTWVWWEITFVLSLGPNGSLFRGSNNHHHLLLVSDKKCTAPLHWLVRWSQEIWFIFHLQWLQWCTSQLKITSEKTLISNFAQ